MPRNVYSEIHFHVTWHTKRNDPVIVDDIERQLHQYVRRRIAEAEEITLHAVGGVADHLHLAVTVAPALNISEWIGQLKGASAHYINHRVANRKILEWQTGYGVVSFGTKDLPWVVDYIRNQKQHHARGATYERLERTERENGKPVKTG